jgi:hypothetical protein
MGTFEGTGFAYEWRSQMTRSVTARGPDSRIALLWLAALALGGACGGEARTGRVDIALEVSPGVTLSTASYDILAPDGHVTTGSVGVGDTTNVPVDVGPLPVATGYLLIVSGVASDGSTGCSGQTPFDVTGGAPGTLVVHLTCGGPPSTGQLLVTGSVNVCPLIDGVSAAPASARVGASMALGAPAHDADGQPAPLTYSWSATGGTLSSTSAPAPTFTCTAAGTAVVTVSVSDGDPGCVDQMSFNVTCSGS